MSGNRSRSSAISSACFFTLSCVRLRAAAECGEWSVSARHPSTIPSIESRPSLHVECMCRSPRMSLRATSVGSVPRLARVTSSSPFLISGGMAGRPSAA